MAKKIRFPLQMDGTDVRTIEELREHFDLESVLGYFANGKLALWLRDRYYDNEAMAVETLSSDDNKLSMKLCGILQVPYTGERADIDIETVRRRQEKIALLRQFSNDESLVAKVDAIAFNQEDLLDILDTGIEKMVYLCKGEFDVPLTVKNITYVGLDKPTVTLRAYDNVDFPSLNLKFVDLHYGWNTSCITSADELYQAEKLYELGKVEEAKAILKRHFEAKDPRAILSKIVDLEMKRAEELYSIYDTEKLLPLAEEYAGYGCAKAKYILGLLYETGFDRLRFPRDDSKRDKMLKEAYEGGYLPAFFRYHIGLFITKDNYQNRTTPDGLAMKEVLSKMQELADDGDSFAANEFARMCINKEYLGLGNDDYPTSIEYFKRSPLVLGCFGLAVRYRNGQGVDKNISTALGYYKKAAEYGYNHSELYVAYYYGENDWDFVWGCDTADSNQYFEWVNKAYDHGNIEAIGRLAWCYSNSYGTSQDYNKSFLLNKEGMEKGCRQAIGNLGWCYEYGGGTSIDMDLAKKYYKMGADMGDDYCKRQCERLGC